MTSVVVVFLVIAAAMAVFGRIVLLTQEKDKD